MLSQHVFAPLLHFGKQQPDNMRLDLAVTSRYPAISRRKARELISQHRILVNERPVSVASREVTEADRIAVVEEAEPIELIRVESDWLAINKPAGIAVQPGRDRRHRSLQENLSSQLKREGQPHALYVVHRIDTGTSGVVIFARSQAAAARLSSLFASGEIRKTYVAVAEGTLEGEVTIDTPIAGRNALTIARPVRPSVHGSLVEIEIKTGRTHQIRIHLASIDHPVVGDRRYGSTINAARMMLHAARLEHPSFGSIEAPVPPEFV